MKKEFDKPTMNPLQKGDEFTVIRVNAKKGMKMPTHHATSEAVIIVEQGEANLQLPDNKEVLIKGKTVILPANQDHSLDIVEDFQAVVIMGAEGEIKFDN